MTALSLDLRSRIVAAYHAAEGSIRELARRFKVAPNTVENQLKLERETGGLAPRPHGGAPPRRLTDEGVQHLRVLVEEKNDRTLAELVDLMAERHQVSVSETTIAKALHDKLGLSRKKKRYVPASRTGPTSSGTARRSKRGSGRRRAIDGSTSTSLGIISV